MLSLFQTRLPHWLCTEVSKCPVDQRHSIALFISTGVHSVLLNNLSFFRQITVLYSNLTTHSKSKEDHLASGFLKSFHLAICWAIEVFSFVLGTMSIVNAQTFWAQFINQLLWLPSMDQNPNISFTSPFVNDNHHHDSNIIFLWIFVFHKIVAIPHCTVV